MLTDREQVAELYNEFRACARRHMRGQPPDCSLQATALVHEACLKLFGSPRIEGAQRGEVLALAASAMRSVLVDHARSRNRSKRTAPGPRVPLDYLCDQHEDRCDDLGALDEVLNELRRFDPEMARAVDLHFFGGLSMAETADLLGLSLRTFQRRWSATRAWLRVQLG